MKKSSILFRLVLAFLLVALTAAAIVATAIRLTSVNRLMELIINQQRADLQAALQTYYTDNGSWNGIEKDWWQIQFKPRNPETYQPDQPVFSTPQLAETGKLPNAQDPNTRDRRNLFGLANAEGVVIVPVEPDYAVGMGLDADQIQRSTDITVNGEQVGVILTAPMNPRFNPEEDLFLRRTNTALLYAAGGAMLVALIIGIILARALIHPLHQLTQAARNIAMGQLEQQVDVRSRDEIGELADAFNRMSHEVARVNQQRRQMTADIAHDLRTPLTVIAGYMESMRDEVLKPTHERLALIYTEIERLQNLVDDLKFLSQMDAGELPMHMTPTSPRSLLEHAAAPFQHRAGQQKVMLIIQAHSDLPSLDFDEGRMMQVLGNLLVNALRYTPSGGKIVLSAEKQGDKLVMAVTDTGTGISPENLPFIFDRFQRADKSRHTDSGESGLGLAIVRALVEAHGGTVGASSEEGRGTRIEMHFPITG